MIRQSIYGMAGNTIISKEREKIMKKKISILALSTVLIAGTAMASGFRIPEQSIDSVAKAGANVASASHADAAYFNPANMSWLAKDSWALEGELTWINLPSITYTDSRSSFMNGSSKTENFLVPTFFLVSPDYNNFRFGISSVAPYGLSKRWEQPFPRSTAEEYSVSVIEVNPTISYAIGEMFSLGGGVRMLYSSAEVSNYAVQSSGLMVTRSMDGDSIDWGYNLAASVRPTDDINISATYRSNVDMKLDGDVTMATNTPAPYLMKTGGAVDLPAPAVLSLSMAYTFGPATVDLTWDRTFWSEYENIALNYSTPIVHPVLNAVFTPSIPKNWEDSNGYRVGFEYVLNPEITLMAGFAYDETPIPDATLGFELPGSNAWLYSIGARYRVSEAMELGFGYLYDYKEKRTVVNGSPTTGINGEFTDAAAHLFSFGLSYDL